jgi:hypothetical protein
MFFYNEKEENISAMENEKIIGDYKFKILYGTLYVYHYTEFRLPISGTLSNDWLCCTEGWNLKDDGKWHETVRCGSRPDRVVDTIDDVISCYVDSQSK